MKLLDVIQQLQQYADQMTEDADFMLYDRTHGREVETDPDEDVWGFEILRGDNTVVIEFE